MSAAAGDSAAAAAGPDTSEPSTAALTGPARGIPDCRLISIEGKAKVWECASFCGRPCIIKQCSARPYRHATFNRKASAGSRLKQEVRSMCRLRKIGLLAPVPYHVDTEHNCLYMEKVDGTSLQQLLQQGSLDEQGLSKVSAGVGRLLGKMHDAGVIHGDLAASKLLVRQQDQEVVLLDLSMSLSSTYPEDKGVDLLLLDQDMQQIQDSSKLHDGKKLFDQIMESYKKHSKQWSATFNKFAEARTKARAGSKKAAVAE